MSPDQPILSIVFFGSDGFSLSALKASLESRHTVSLVVTTPPSRKGRGMHVQANEVQTFCEETDIPFIAPEDLKSDSVFETIQELKSDLFVVSSYGKYIPSRYLPLPSIAPLNVHPSLIPRYRGSGPIQWAILNGDKTTGLTIMEVSKKLDAGDVFVQKEIPLEPDDTHVSLERKLADMSYGVLKELLNELPGRELTRVPQEEGESCYARKLFKEDGRLLFGEKAEVLERKVRGLKPWPGTFMETQNGRVAVHSAALSTETGEGGPGTVLSVSEQGMTVQTAEGALTLIEVQPAGKKPMKARDFANGNRIKPGFVFESK